MRRVTAGAAAAALLVPAVLAASAGAAPAAYDANGATLNILPPGSNGNVNAAQALQYETTKQTPAHFDDQLAMYDALNRVSPYAIAPKDLTKYYKDAALGGGSVPIVSTETPKPGVVIKRDAMGVPHITGTTAQDVAYGAGYAGIEDRMFLTDILRHTGAADMSAFLGATPGDIAMDQSQLQLAPYTPQEAENQINSAVTRYGAEGKALLARLDAFIAGMNAAQQALCPGAFGLPVPGDNGVGLGPNCPAEYAALQKNPRPYTRADIVYIASLVGGIFGKGGGNEYQNALFFQALRDKFGDGQARTLYDQLRQKNDPEAFTTSSLRFPYLTGGVDPAKAGVAMPIPGAATAPGTGAPASSNQLPVSAPPVPGTRAYLKWEAVAGKVQTPFGQLDLSRHPKDESNALLVDANHSANGHPVVVFGPQTGYFTPQLLTEVDLHGPGIDARGVSFAGTQFVVELGHGVDYAWSATSADADNVDTVMERLCNPDGTPATVDSTHYLDRGKCVPIDEFTHDEGLVLPTAAGQAPPQELAFTVMRTRHGIVQFRTLAQGPGGAKVPVAVVKERSTYGHEADSAIGFARVDNPAYVHNAGDFEKAFAGVDYTFNWFYADNKDIAYKVSGLLPVRSSSVEPDFPRWGDATYDWKSWLPASAHPHQVNPPAGFLTSWNNKQAPGFGVADDQWGQNGVHRVNLLAERIQALFRHGKVTRQRLVGAMIDAATVDLRAEKLLPLALDVLGNDAQDPAAVKLLRQWVADGTHRVDRARTGHYGDQAAIALWDTWWDDNGKADGGLAKDSLRAKLGDLVDKLPYGTDDHPRQGLGSSWDTVAWYGYVSKALRAALGRKVTAPWSSAYCGDLATCRAAMQASLHTAVQRALTAQKVSAVDQLTYDKTLDDIAPRTAGIVGTRTIDWQNRPTFQQVVNFTSHRPTRPTRVVPARVLPRTGGTGLARLGALAAVVVAVVLAALRRRGEAGRRGGLVVAAGHVAAARG